MTTVTVGIHGILGHFFRFSENRHFTTIFSLNTKKPTNPHKVKSEILKHFFEKIQKKAKTGIPHQFRAQIDCQVDLRPKSGIPINHIREKRPHIRPILA